MQLSWHRIAAHETDHELLWLSVSAASLASAGIWLALGLPWPSCVFHDLTGLPCLTCGATRSAIEFFHGHFFAAWNWNPFAFMVWCGIAVFDLYALIGLVTRAPRLRLMRFTRTEKNVSRIFIIALLALNWVWVLSHGQPM
jgi:uncharacterized protein DUF2752